MFIEVSSALVGSLPPVVPWALMDSSIHGATLPYQGRPSSCKEVTLKLSISCSLVETIISLKGQWYSLEVMMSSRACGKVAQRTIVCAGEGDTWGELTRLGHSHNVPQVQAVRPKSSSVFWLSTPELTGKKTGAMALPLLMYTSALQPKSVFSSQGRWLTEAVPGQTSVKLK